MGRTPRFLPANNDGVLVEVTCRTVGANALLVPSPNPRLFNEVIVGVMGRALEVSPLELCAAVWMSNHVHLLCVVHEQQELSRFMHHLACNVSKEIRRKRPWQGPLWARRYDGIVVSDEPDAQWRRLEYLLSHGVKEELVESPLEWPGVHSAGALIHGETLEGYWFNRSKEAAARHCGKPYGRYDFATRYEVGFAPLPAFRDHLTAEEYQERVAELVREIERKGAEQRGDNPVAGVEKILALNPYKPPTREPKTSPKPRFHVASKDAKGLLQGELDIFLARYWEASEALRLHRRLEAATWFPDGSYPPALPFVGDPPPPRPPAPPTRRLDASGAGVQGPEAVPTVVIPSRIWRVEPRSRGQPP